MKRQNKKASEALKAHRLWTCAGCDELGEDGSTCRKCGKPIQQKASPKASACPGGRW